MENERCKLCLKVKSLVKSHVIPELVYKAAYTSKGGALSFNTKFDFVRILRKGVRSVGVTSAASTPDDLVQEIVCYFQIRNPEVEIIEEGEWENITFRQPKRVPPRLAS